MKLKMKLAICLFAFPILSLSAPTITAEPQKNSEKTLEGYDMMDMNQFKDLNTAASKSGVKFQSNCTNKAGEVITSTDSRFSECMNQSLTNMKQKRALGQDKNPAGNPSTGVTFGTDN